MGLFRDHSCTGKIVLVQREKQLDGGRNKMGRGIEGLEVAYQILFTGVLIILAMLVLLCLARAVAGPRIADRIVAVNMMGTMVIVMIAILSLMLGEGYLVDICIIYAMISFLAVIALTKIYMGVYMQKKEGEERRDDSI